ncbi:hypothetical protein [Paraburkholderia bannensis]|uniref:hypothetical protein n=1 Tax=Paraburkholderia bannensis TaxID=765414 RepID=UPI002ABE408B|nr:hypothetical protein [Paraburkholderia bannensis]
MKTFHQSVMESVGLSADAATAHIVKYNAMVERLNAAQDAQAAANRLRALADDGNDGAGSDDSTPLGDAEMMACSLAGAMYRDPRTFALCKQRAFQNYQACRGYL